MLELIKEVRSLRAEVHEIDLKQEALNTAFESYVNTNYLEKKK